MAKFMEVINYIMANWEIFTGIILGLLAVVEFIVRLTPTEKDNGAVERIGAIIRKVLDVLKVPNAKKDEAK